MYHQALSPRSCVWGGNVGVVSVTPVQLCGCSQGCGEQAKCGASSPLLRNVRFVSCVSVRRRACFLATTMDRFTWSPIRAISALCNGMLRSIWMATEFLAIRKVHGCILVTPAAVCFCKRPISDLESCGSFWLSSLREAIPSSGLCFRFLHFARLRVATTSWSLLWWRFMCRVSKTSGRKELIEHLSN